MTVTILDGLVLARSVMHHSMNYRSAVMYGTMYEIVNADEHLRALRVITEHLSRDGWSVCPRAEPPASSRRRWSSRSI